LYYVIHLVDDHGENIGPEYFDGLRVTNIMNDQMENHNSHTKVHPSVCYSIWGKNRLRDENGKGKVK